MSCLEADVSILGTDVENMCPGTQEPLSFWVNKASPDRHIELVSSCPKRGRSGYFNEYGWASHPPYGRRYCLVYTDLIGKSRRYSFL